MFMHLIILCVLLCEKEREREALQFIYFPPFVIALKYQLYGFSTVVNTAYIMMLACR